MIKLPDGIEPSGKVTITGLPEPREVTDLYRTALGDIVYRGEDGKIWTRPAEQFFTNVAVKTRDTVDAIKAFKDGDSGGQRREESTVTPTKPGFYWHLFPDGYGEQSQGVFERLECVKVTLDEHWIVVVDGKGSVVPTLVGDAWHGQSEPIEGECFPGEWIGEAVPPLTG